MLESLSRRLAIFIFLLILLLLTSSFCFFFFLRCPVVVLGSQLPYHPQLHPFSLSLSLSLCLRSAGFLTTFVARISDLYVSSALK
jgi:hypothetical protein